MIMGIETTIERLVSKGKHNGIDNGTLFARLFPIQD